MVDAERGDAANGRRGDDIGRVEPSAQTYLDDARIGWRSRKGEEGGSCGDLKEARLQSVGMVQNFGEQRSKGRVVNQFSGNPDPFVKADQMRAGINMSGQPRRFDRPPQKRAGRTFAIRSRHVEYRRQIMMRVAQPFKQSRNPLQPQDIASRREHG